MSRPSPERCGRSRTPGPTRRWRRAAAGMSSGKGEMTMPGWIDHRPGKRVFDIVVSGLVLLVLAPVLLTIAAAEWLSGGPALYRQERVTLWGERFKILKFR